jgi:hypothetical protein
MTRRDFLPAVLCDLHVGVRLSRGSGSLRANRSSRDCENSGSRWRDVTQIRAMGHASTDRIIRPMTDDPIEVGARLDQTDRRLTRQFPRTPAALSKSLASRKSFWTTAPNCRPQFHWHLEGLDIRHVYIKPRTPHLNGKVERSHRVDDQEFYLTSRRRASATTSICSTRSCGSGRTTTITTAHTGRWTVKPRTSDCWQKRERKHYRSL